MEEGIAAGYPGYFCRLETWILSLESWLHRIEIGLLKGNLPSNVTLGDRFSFPRMEIRGLTLWQVLNIHVGNTNDSTMGKSNWHSNSGMFGESSDKYRCGMVQKWAVPLTDT